MDYGTEHRANQALCRLFDKGLIDGKTWRNPNSVIKNGDKYRLNTGTKYDNLNVFAKG